MNLPTATFIILVGLCMVTGHPNKPQLNPLNIPKDLVKGQRYKLDCECSSRDSGLQFEWLKDGEVIETTLHRPIFQTKPHTSTLIFYSLTENDSGHYRCEASTWNGTASVEDQLEVNVPPFWLELPQNISIYEDKPAKLSCHAGGTPPPIYQWSKDSQILTGGRYHVDTDGELLIGNVKDIDAGIYTCTASNGFGPAIVKRTTVRVHLRPQVKPIQSGVRVQLGDNAKLSCSVTGTQPIYVEWLRNGEIVQRKLTLPDLSGQKNDMIVSDFVVKKVATGDAGWYKCVAKNFLGQSQADIRLILQERAKTPKDFRVSETWSRHLQLKWESGKSDQVTSYDVWYWSSRDSRKFNVSVSGLHNEVWLRNLHPATDYQLYIVAHNAIGPSEQSPTITACTSDEAPSGAPTNVQVVSTGGDQATISWTAPAESSWNSKNLTGYYVGYKATHPDSGRPYAFYTVAPDETSHTLWGLMRHTRYSVVVQAINSAGYSPQSEEASFYTERGSSVPKLPLQLQSIGEKSVTLRWSLPLIEVTGFLVYSREESQHVWKKTYIDDPVVDTFQLTELTPGKVYQIYLVALTRQGKTEPSNALLVRMVDNNTLSDADKMLDLIYGLKIETIVQIVCVLLVIVTVLFATGCYMCARRNRPAPRPAAWPVAPSIIIPDYSTYSHNIPGVQRAYSTRTVRSTPCSVDGSNLYPNLPEGPVYNRDDYTL